MIYVRNILLLNADKLFCERWGIFHLAKLHNLVVDIAEN